MSDFVVPTIDHAGTFDALSTAKPGEPLFPLKGGDLFAAPTVLYWAGLCRTAGLAETDESKADHLLRKASSAEHVAWAMQAYLRGETQPEERRASYQDDNRAARARPVESDKSRDARVARIRAASALSNALSIANEQADILAKLGVCPDEQAKIKEAVETLRAAASGVDPRRGMERS